MRPWIRRPLMFVFAMTMAACGQGSTAPSPPPASPANAAGLWLGTIGGTSEEGRPLAVLWDASETGNTVSGIARFYTGPLSTDRVTFAGPLTGTRTGNQLTLSFTATPGTVLAGACALTGIGTATLNDGTLTGTLSVSLGSCDGLEPPASMDLLLKRQ